MSSGVSGYYIGQIIGRILGHNTIFAILIAIDCSRAKQNKKDIGLFIVGIAWQALLSFFYISAGDRIWNGEDIWYLHVSSVVVGIIGYFLLKAFPGSRNNWWLLSSYSGNSTNWCNVNNNGNANNNSATNTGIRALP